MFYVMHNTQIFHSIIVMYAVYVIDLLSRTKLFNKRIGNKSMH